MFDYVVVGAGSAGCVMASRLSEDPRLRVLLLEAGGDDDSPDVTTPAVFARLFGSPRDWAYQAEGTSPDKPQLWPRGRMVGGSSSMNAMMYVRGHASDYDAWAAFGNEGWAYRDVLPWFRACEDNERGAGAFHGVGGPVRVADLRSPNPLSEAFVAAAAALGIPRNDDVNGERQAGVGLVQVTQRDGRRWSAADGYLRPAMGRPNLAVATGAQATAITFAGRRATGVRYLLAGREETAAARREVVLCAGAIGSPQLLLLSGVGPAAELAALGIPVVADLPGVGRNLQDHPAIMVTRHSTLPVTLAAAREPVHVESFRREGRGPLTSNVAEALAFVRTREALPAPDVEVLFAPAFFMEHGRANPRGHGFSVGAVLLRPASRGEVTLRSRDPLAAPRIDPRTFTAPGDLETLVAGLRLARRIAHTPPLDDAGGEEVWPGAAVEGDEALAGFVRERFQSLYHPVGTCRMGVSDDAVVDPRLAVRGVGGLRVVDASVMPTLPGGHTHAPTVMIAERAAQSVLATARRDAAAAAGEPEPGSRLAEPGRPP